MRAVDAGGTAFLRKHQHSVYITVIRAQTCSSNNQGLSALRKHCSKCASTGNDRDTGIRATARLGVDGGRRVFIPGAAAEFGRGRRCGTASELGAAYQRLSGRHQGPKSRTVAPKWAPSASPPSRRSLPTSCRREVLFCSASCMRMYRVVPTQQPASSPSTADLPRRELQ